MSNVELTTTATIPSTNQGITVTVYEDTDGDGTAENSNSVSIADGTNTYTLSGFDGSSGNDWWLDVDLSTTSSDITQSPRLDTATLDTSLSVTVTDSGSITTAAGSSKTASETATLSESGSTTGASGSLLTAGESASLTTSPGPVTATATPLTATASAFVTISGTATLNGNAVQGAKVYVIDTSNDTIQTTATTDSNGNYAVSVPYGPEYHIAAQYESGGDQYNAESKPFVT